MKIKLHKKKKINWASDSALDDWSKEWKEESKNEQETKKIGDLS